MASKLTGVYVDQLIQTSSLEKVLTSNIQGKHHEFKYDTTVPLLDPETIDDIYNLLDGHVYF